MKFSWINSTFTRHAKERLSKRFQISEQELSDVGGIGVNLGVSRETNLYHRLVWSEKDENHIVIIQDVIDGAILTVLTVSMYQRDYPDKVSDKKLHKAINQAKNVRQRAKRREQKKLSVVGIFVSDDGQRFVKTIGKWKGQVPEEEIENLGSKKKFWNWV